MHLAAGHSSACQDVRFACAARVASESTFGDDEFEGTASFAIGDYDKLKKPEFSTGYVPTILLVQDGKCAPSRLDLRAWSSDRR
eukprot:2142789-Prymnesium_polylepis.2